MRRSFLLVAAPLGVAALVILLTANIPSQTTLIEDGDLDAASIEMDHNAMLTNDPSKNAAFLKAFSSYLPSGQQQSAQLASARGTTQLAQQSHGNHRSISAGAQQRLNAKLAASMQSQLTASSQGDALMTPHFVAALDAASRMAAKQQMLASSPAIARQEERKQVMDAMTMSEKGAQTHLLPPALRQKYAFTKTKNKLGSTNIVTPQELDNNNGMTSLRQQAQPNPTGGASSDAAKADNSFLAASQSQQPAMTAKQLIQQAALAQMNQLQSNALASSAAPAAPQQQLAAAPAMPQAPMQPQPRGMYSPGMQELAQQSGAPPQQAEQAPTQQMYQQPAYQYQPQPAYQYQQAPTQQMYQYQQPQQAPTQQMYQQPARPAYSGYGYAQPAQPSMYAPAQTQMTYQQPAPAQYQQQYQQPPQQPQPSMYEAQQQALSQDSGPLSESAPSAAVGSGSSGGVPPNWRAPDMALKQGGSVIGMSAAKKAKVKQQMMALRSQIESDFKHNTKVGDTALLLGPGGL